MDELEPIRSFREHDVTPNPVARAIARDRLIARVATAAQTREPRSNADPALPESQGVSRQRAADNRSMTDDGRAQLEFPDGLPMQTTAFVHALGESSLGTTSRGDAHGSGGTGVRRRRRSQTPVGSVHDLQSSLERASRETLDFAEAFATSCRVLRHVRSGRVDADNDYGTVERAAEFLWDHDHLEQATDLVDAWARFIQSVKLRASVPDQVLSARDTRAVRLRAALMHRSYDPIGAWTLVKAEYRRLKHQAGGTGALSTLARAEPFEGLGLQYTELLDVAVPASRRVSESMRAPHREIFLMDATTIINQIRDLGDRHRARFRLVDQALFAILEMREMRDPRGDADLVARYYGLDMRLRPRDRRGLATSHLMNMEMARYQRDEATAQIYLSRAIKDLRSVALHRHIREVRGRYA